MNPRIDWHDKKVLNAVAASVREASKEGAKLVLRDAKRRVPVGKTGELKKSLGIKKSQYKDGGYIIGAFDKVAVGGFFRWQDSIGARAVFVEYGHAAPGMGKGRQNPAGPGRIWKAGSKVTRPRPFLKPSLHRNEPKIGKIFQDFLDSLE